MSRKYILKGGAPIIRTKIDYGRELNPEQLKVVLEGEGHCLVLSGPGSGKTRTLVYRTVYLLEKGVPPSNILLVTFTKKAAKEMLNRVELLLGFRPNGLWGGTFHHIGNLILRKYANYLGYGRNFSILDRGDAGDLISIVMQDLNIQRIKDKNIPRPEVIQEIISLSVNSRKPIRKIIEENFSYLSTEEGGADIIPLIETIKKAYDAKKRECNLMDYDDLLANWLELLVKFTEIRKNISSRFKYILVDEYQDVNSIQDEIIEKIGEIHKNILVVGDDAQSIYSFRGAEIKNILNFPKKYSDVKIFKLETNYRSTPEILNLANEIIKHNKYQLQKTLKSIKRNGNLPVLVALETPTHQAEFVVQRILELQNEGTLLSEIAVLFRAHYHSAELELELIKRNIPYIVRGGARFFEQLHIKDILAFLRILTNFKDEIAWERILKRQEGIGLIYSRRIFAEISKQKNIQALFDADVINNFAKFLSQKAARGFKGVVTLFESIYKIYLDRKEGYISKIILCILENWYKDYLQISFVDARDRIEDVRQLANLSLNYSDINKMLAAFSLSEEFKGESLRRYREGFDKVLTLSTIHQAKGLEWKVVFIISLEDGKFPHAKSLVDEYFLEEERRLFYVAVTRCKEELYLTYPLLYWRGGNNILTQPSRFIKELNSNLFEKWEIIEEIEEDTKKM